MNRVSDRAQARRTYLWKKSKAYSIMAISGFVSFVSLMCLVLLVWLMAVLHGFYYYGPYPEPTLWQDYLSATPIFVGFIAFGIVGYVVCRKTWNVADNLYPIPPVREQIPHLPAEEVLLRGSQASAASPEELLRPAGMQETPAEELLRSSVRTDSEEQ